MSMNLVFRHQNGSMVEFPYQTQTSITARVLASNSQTERLDILRQDNPEVYPEVVKMMGRVELTLEEY